MSDKEIDAAIAIGWPAEVYKRWESSLVESLMGELKVSFAEAKRLLRRMENLGFIAEANDLDYPADRVYSARIAFGVEPSGSTDRTF